jgi:hypothetical protein
MTAKQITRAQGTELQNNPGFVLLRDAAFAWDRASDEFGKVVAITGAWRSYAKQEELFLERYDRGNFAGHPGYTNDVRLWPGHGYWTRRAGTAAAAVPGTSNHGGGLSVDAKTRRDEGDPPYEAMVVFTSFVDEDRKAFLKVANKHGWYDDEGRDVDEFWHLTYYPERDQFRGQPPKKEEDEMPSIEEIKKAVGEEIRAEYRRHFKVPANLQQYLGKTATRDQILIAIAFRTTVAVRNAADEKKLSEQILEAVKDLEPTDEPPAQS